ncbi:MAG: hypothetical protein ACI4TZ_01840 [Christensenellales bacterium]
MNVKIVKKILIICCVLTGFCATFYSGSFVNKNFDVCIHISYNLDITDELNDIVNDQLDSLEEENFDDILDNLTKEQQGIFGQVDFTEKIKQLIGGEGQVSFGDVISFILSLLVDNLTGIIPMLATICAIAIISNILLQIRGKSLNQPLGDIIHFACYSVIVLLVITSVLQLVQLTSNTLNSLKSQMEIAFPLLLTIMAGLGASTSVGIYQPIVAILCGAMMQLFLKIVLPIFSLSIIFGVIGNMSSSVKLTKMADFFKNLFKYVIGFTFTIFSGALAVSGIMAGSYDGVSIRATKYAIKSYIPIMGSYLSDGFSLIMASSVLIKNAIGYSGLLIMFLTIVSPLLKIFLFKLGLNLVAGIIEPIADNRVTSFISQTAKSLSMLSSVILAFSFAYFVSVGLMMCTSNVL